MSPTLIGPSVSPGSSLIREPGPRPTDVTGCQLWIRGDFARRATDHTKSGVISDLSGRDLGFSESDSALQPTRSSAIAAYNRMPGLQFDAGATTKMTAAAAADWKWAHAAAGCIFWVGHETTGSLRVLFATGPRGNANNHGITLYYTAGGTPQMRVQVANGSGTFYFDTGALNVPAGANIGSLRWSAADGWELRHWVGAGDSSTDVVSGSASPNNPSQIPTIGSDAPSGSHATGPLLDLFGYNRRPDDVELNYLGNEYAKSRYQL